MGAGTNAVAAENVHLSCIEDNDIIAEVELDNITDIYKSINVLDALRLQIIVNRVIEIGNWKAFV